MRLEGTPSDQLPDVLATGATDARFTFVSLSAREPDGRDAEYIEWHSLDHRPEQYRLPGLRNSLRLVSTPECRAARAASHSSFDAVDHVMTYQFADDREMPGFGDLGAALGHGGRMPLRLPSLGYMTAVLAGKIAAPHALAGADVIPWRPATGVYLLIEEGHASPAPLVGIPGVAGIWWHHGSETEPYGAQGRGRQLTYCYLDEDPVAVAMRLAAAVQQRWASAAVNGLLAAPFYAITPFEWARRLPG
jgi:hypothetical protein